MADHIDHAFWHDRWSSGSTAFDQADANSLLTRYWSELGLPKGSDVFVPLCGKTVDMTWLATLGHRVIGNELSPVAIEAFLKENGLGAVQHREPKFTVYEASGYEFWCGDLFEMPAAPLTEIAAVYDRASLVALPAYARKRYARYIADIIPGEAVVFQVALEYDQAEMGGPPFSVSVTEIKELYGDAFALEVIASENAIDRNDGLRARGLSRLNELLVILRRR
jgi:thiopurine S-methyltransferase